MSTRQASFRSFFRKSVPKKIEVPPLTEQERLKKINEGLSETNIWGAKLWESLHIMAARAPEVLDDDTKAAFSDLLQALPFTLACGTCAEHFDKMLDEYPLSDEILATRISLSKYLFDRHNMVNERLKQPVFTAKQFQEQYGIVLP